MFKISTDFLINQSFYFWFDFHGCFPYLISIVRIGLNVFSIKTFLAGAQIRLDLKKPQFWIILVDFGAVCLGRLSSVHNGI